MSLALSNRLSGEILLTVLAALLIPPIAAPNTSEQSCGGLHAAIRGELVRRDAPYTEPPFVMLSFILLNDSEQPIDAAAEDWRIVIDGKELADSGYIFGNGPGPVGGWGVLNPGESYQFGKALPVGEYFPVEREYRVFWRSKGFRSSTITVRVTPK